MNRRTRLPSEKRRTDRLQIQIGGTIASVGKTKEVYVHAADQIASQKVWAVMSLSITVANLSDGKWLLSKRVLITIPVFIERQGRKREPRLCQARQQANPLSGDRRS